MESRRKPVSAETCRRMKGRAPGSKPAVPCASEPEQAGPGSGRSRRARAVPAHRGQGRTRFSALTWIKESPLRAEHPLTGYLQEAPMGIRPEAHQPAVEVLVRWIRD